MRLAASAALVFLSLLLLACNREAEMSPEVSGGPPDQTSFTPDGPRITATVPLKIGTPSSVAVNPSTQVVYVVYRDVDVLSLLDATTFEPKGRIDFLAGGLQS